MMNCAGLCTLALVVACAAVGPGRCEPEAAANKKLILATTTSTQDSGLLDVLDVLDVLVPTFQKKMGYVVKTVAVGTGQALALGRRADVLLVHSPPEEERFMAEGHGVRRQSFMYNQFVIVGPANDPAKVSRASSAVEALKRIADSQALFLSRGDNSGTHILEKKLWSEARPPSGSWYQESGQGMGQTLTIASEKKAYTLTDSGTYLSLKKRLELSIVFSKGESKLRNIYSVIQVNPQKNSMINGAGARAFFDFIVSREAGKIIKDFGRKDHGQPLFYLLKR